MTPCEEKGYKVGDKFIANEVEAPFSFDKGEVVILTYDDGSECPRFKSEINGRKGFAFLYEVKKVEQKPDWNGEGLPPVGVECELCNCGSNWKMAKVLFMGTGLCVVDHGYGDQHYHLNSVKFRKPETPQQREERERLEAAYDLYCDFTVQRKPLDWFRDKNPVLRDKWLSIVDKTGYRKAK